MERIVALCFALALAGTPAAAQTLATPAPAQAPADDLAFDVLDERMTVPVEIAGAGPYPFIVDTGAQRSVVSRQLARRLGLPSGRRVRLTAMSGSSDVETVIVPSLTLSAPTKPGLGGQRIEAPALEAQHLGAPGMLGIDTLQDRAVVIDFDKRAMTVATSTKRDARRRAAADEIVIQAKSLFGQLVVTDAFVLGKRVRVILDTGTPVSIGNVALRQLIAKRKVETTPAVFTSVLGDQITADYVIIPEMKLGDATLTSLPVAFSDVAPFRAFGVEDKPAILLGMDALQLFRRVHIDFANRQLRLAMPRTAVRQPAMRFGPS
jgi:predicted aspartyl protease